MSWARLIVMLGCALLIAVGAACAEGVVEESSEAQAPTAAPTSTVVTPSACAPARVQPAGEQRLTIEAGDGVEVLVTTPSAYEGATPLPLLLNYHGAGGTPERQNERSRLPATAEREGFLLVALPVGSNAGAILDGVESEWCVDSTRVYATGISAGARVSSTLLCELSDRITAVAAIAGIDYPAEACAGVGPKPIAALHGTADTVLAFAGAQDAAAAWARHNGCDRQPQPEPFTESVTLIHYADCANGASVELYAIEGGGHRWPGAEPRPDDRPGETTQEIDANEVMWAFFEAHALR